MKSLTIYQIQKSLYNVTIPKIITKILESKRKIFLLCKNVEEMNYFDDLMWTFSQLSFLPHSTENDNYNKDCGINGRNSKNKKKK